MARRRLRLFILLGVAAYLLSLIATLPARLLFADARDDAVLGTVTGTIWSGEGSMNAGHSLRWDWAPLDSLAQFGFVVDLSVRGPDTALSGQASWRPGRVELSNIEGPATGTLISAIFPTLPFTCDFPMVVNLNKVRLSGRRPGVDGEVRTEGGLCATRASSIAATSIMPPLIGRSAITIGGSSGFIDTRSRSERILTSSITPGGEVSVSVLPRAAALLPGDVARSLNIRTRL